MSLPTEHFVLKENGLIYRIEKMPEMPVPYGVGDEQYFGGRMDAYQQALQSAIDNAVEVGNFDETEDALLDAHATGHGFRLEVGKVYSLQCSVEKKEFCKANGYNCPIHDSTLHKIVVLVTFSEPEPMKETQEELWQTSNPNKPKYIACTNIYTEGLPESWLRLMEQIQLWYGDIQKRETGEQLVIRLMNEYNLTRKHS